MSEVPLHMDYSRRTARPALQGYLAHKKQRPPYCPQEPLGGRYRGTLYLAHKKTPTPLGPPYGPRHRATVGS